MDNETAAKSLGITLSEYLNNILDTNMTTLAQDIIIASELNMTIGEFRDHTRKELEYCIIKDKSKKIDNLHTEINAFISEKLFIECNLIKICTYAGVPQNTYLLGNTSSQIIQDYIYKSVRTVNRDIINIIMSNFKIINIKKISVAISKNINKHYSDSDSDYGYGSEYSE
jgi:hypothetical protein